MNFSLKKLLEKITGSVDEIISSPIMTGVVYNFGAITGGVWSDKLINTGSSWAGFATFTLPPGAWLVMITVQFSTNNTGYRQFTVSDTNETSAGVLNRTTRMPATPGAATAWSMCFPADGNQKYYVNVCQNSGTQLTVYGRYTAIKLGNEFRTVT